MIRVIQLCFFVAAFLFAFCAKAQDAEVQVMTYNIRYDNPADPLPWEDRRDEVAEVIMFNDIIGVQEALAHQVDYIAGKLSHHEWYGVGRDDGRRKGEFSPVFWNTFEFEFIHGETIWLSPFPKQTGSIGWDAQMPRIATIVILQHKQTRQTYRVINTHFSHIGETAKQMAARLLRGYAVSNNQDVVLLMGDFNTEPDEEAYKLLNAAPLSDSHDSAKRRCRTTLATYTSFDPDDIHMKRLDYIFTNAGEVVWACINEQIKYGFFLSDHQPYFIILPAEAK